MHYVLAMESKSLEYINDVSIYSYTSLAKDFENRLENQVTNIFHTIDLALSLQDKSFKCRRIECIRFLIDFRSKVFGKQGSVTNTTMVFLATKLILCGKCF